MSLTKRWKPAHENFLLEGGIFGVGGPGNSLSVGLPLQRQRRFSLEVQSMLVRVLQITGEHSLPQRQTAGAEASPHI